MDILYVIGKLDVGGAELHLLNVSKKLLARGHSVTIFPLKRDGVLENIFIENGIQVKGKNNNNKGKLGVILSAIQLTVCLRKHRFEIIHFFLPEAYVIGAVCTFFSPKIIRVMSRRSLNLYQNRFYFLGLVEKYLHNKMNAILGNSKAVCAELKKEGVPENKLKLIYNGIDVDRFASIHAADKNVDSSRENELTLLCVANLIPYKGHEDLIRALSLIKNDINVKWRLLLAGRDDGHGEYLTSLAKELNLESHIKLLGVVDDIPDLINHSDIGVLCSHQEGFSNSILECMGGGLPMVVTNVGGNAEAVLNDKVGLVVEPFSPELIGEAILTLIKNESLRAEMRCAAKERVRDNFSIESCVGHYENLYFNLIHKQSKNLPQ